MRHVPLLSGMKKLRDRKVEVSARDTGGMKCWVGSRLNAVLAGSTAYAINTPQI